jgi:hypothetical protein
MSLWIFSDFQFSFRILIYFLFSDKNDIYINFKDVSKIFLPTALLLFKTENNDEAQFSS